MYNTLLITKYERGETKTTGEGLMNDIQKTSFTQSLTHRASVMPHFLSLSLVHPEWPYCCSITSVVLENQFQPRLIHVTCAYR